VPPHEAVVRLHATACTATRCRSYPSVTSLNGPVDGDFVAPKATGAGAYSNSHSRQQQSRYRPCSDHDLFTTVFVQEVKATDIT